jgi:hypothetical protein
VFVTVEQATTSNTTIIGVEMSQRRNATAVKMCPL